MNEFEMKELLASALDGLTQTLQSLNDIDDIDFEVEIVIGKIENAYDALLRIYES
jgi:hypothetical protein